MERTTMKTPTWGFSSKYQSLQSHGWQRVSNVVENSANIMLWRVVVVHSAEIRSHRMIREKPYILVTAGWSADILACLARDQRHLVLKLKILKIWDLVDMLSIVVAVHQAFFTIIMGWGRMFKKFVSPRTPLLSASWSSPTAPRSRQLPWSACKSL